MLGPLLVAVTPVGARLSPDAQSSAALVPRHSPLPLELPIINLGLPKSGSTSLRDFFACGKLNASHFKCEKGPCGMCAHKNIEAGRPPLEGCGNYDVFAQLDWAPIGLPIPKDAPCFFPQLSALKELHKQHPKATFVLPTRPPMHWIASVDGWKHGSYRMRQVLAKCRLPGMPAGRGPDDAELAAFYVRHSREVRKFVEDHPSHKLIEFDLESPHVAKHLAAETGVPPRCWGMSNCKTSCHRGASKGLEDVMNMSTSMVQLEKRRKPAPSPVASPAPSPLMASPSPSPWSLEASPLPSPNQQTLAERLNLNLNQLCIAAHRREEHTSHFYHFFLGEFLPVIASVAHAERANPGAKILLHLRSNLPTDSRLNPLMRFYTNLEETHGQLAIIRETYSSDELRGQLGCLHTHQGDAWDFGTSVYSRFSKTERLQHRGKRAPAFDHSGGDIEAARLAVEWLKEWSEKTSRAHHAKEHVKSNSTEVLVQLREEVLSAMDVEFLKGVPNGHGQARVSGLEALALELREENGLSAQTFFGDSYPLNEQMRAYQNADALIAGHGAGMVWSLFLPQKSTLIEVLTHNKIRKDNTALQGFHRIAQIAKASAFVRLVMKNKADSAATRVRQAAGAIRLGAGFVRFWPCCKAEGEGNVTGTNLLWPQCPFSMEDTSWSDNRTRGPDRFLPFGPRAWGQNKTASMPVPTAICDSPAHCCRCCAPGEEEPGDQPGGEEPGEDGGFVGA